MTTMHKHKTTVAVGIEEKGKAEEWEERKKRIQETEEDDADHADVLAISVSVADGDLLNHEL